jgi:hypothetical protein
MGEKVSYLKLNGAENEVHVVSLEKDTSLYFSLELFHCTG